MQQIKIISVGKNKEEWLEHALAEYCKRLKSTVSLEFIWAKDDPHLLALVEKEALVICLDSTGLQMTSEDFSTYFHKKMVESGSRLTFVIGGAEGLPPALKKRSGLVSFSKMTFTHQIIRLILVEQIYRAYEIAKGTGYHK